MNAPTDSYPLRYEVDYPDQPRNRLTTFFRLFTCIPILIVLVSLGGIDLERQDPAFIELLSSISGLLFIPAVLMLLFRRKYPRWWFDWNLELLRFSYRVSAYVGLLRDEYPSTDEEQAVHLDIDYPDAQRDLNRWLPLVKWFLVIPHYIILIPLIFVVLLCTIGAWFAILFTGHHPRGLFNLVVGVTRWWLRVHVYAFILVTDQYPPFRLSD